MTGGTPYYLTTPIYYVNASPHIGHAYTSVAADALARFMRLDGRRVHFLTGTDEHGQKVEQAARAGGVEPAGTFCDRISAEFPRHDAADERQQRRLHPHHRAAPHRGRARRCGGSSQRRGEIYLGNFAGWYSVRDEAFYDESELVDGKSADRRRGRVGRGGELFLPPCRLAGPPARLLRGQSRFHRAARAPQRGDELRQGRAARSLDLAHQLHAGAFPVPGDEKHVMYVWLDALTNYITARRAIPRPAARLSRPFGRPICTWSARTSSASIASIGRPS